MALRDQPYLPLYVGDFLSDEKLALCSAESTGVYIRLMCLMHKSQEYGVISLSDADKISDNQIENFAVLLSKLMPYGHVQISCSISELLDRKVLQIKGDKLSQKRMVADGKLSEKRAAAGFKGGKQKPSKSFSKTAAKCEANTENEIEVENIEIIKTTESEDKDVGTESKGTGVQGENPELGKVMTLYMDKVCASPSSGCTQELIAYTEQLTGEVVCHAIYIALDEGKRSWSYIRGILRSYAAGGVKSLEDVQRMEQEHDQKRNSSPSGKPGKKFTTAAEYVPPTVQKDSVKELRKKLEKIGGA